MESVRWRDAQNTENLLQLVDKLQSKADNSPNLGTCSTKHNKQQASRMCQSGTEMFKSSERFRNPVLGFICPTFLFKDKIIYQGEFYKANIILKTNKNHILDFVVYMNTFSNYN